MTEAVLSVDVGSPVSEALRLFAEFPVHHLPVVRDGKLVGMLGSADLRKLEGFLPKNAVSGADFLDQRFSIEAMMSRPAISIQSHRSVEDAARLMVTHGIHALPVVNDQDRLLGIVTPTDVMQALMYGAPRREGHAGMTPAAGSAEPALSTLALDAALDAAREAVASERDPNGIARALLQVYQRVIDLEEVQQMVHGYVTARQNEVETLVKALRQSVGIEEREQQEPQEQTESSLAPGYRALGGD